LQTIRHENATLLRRMAQQDEALEAKRDEADMLREQLRQASEAYNKALQDAENLKKDLADEREKCVSLEHRLSQLWHRMSELERTAAESATELQRSRVGMAQLEELRIVAEMTSRELTDQKCRATSGTSVGTLTHICSYMFFGRSQLRFATVIIDDK
jgi:chromosome segregation ATPase